MPPSLFTIPDSSPGTILSFSPVWTAPAHTRPVTPVADPEPLKTFEMGNRNGEVMSRAGGCSLSMASQTLA
jgi:hypothetical protein